VSGCVVVFGREPIPGAVKTRLAASVGDEAAAAIYRELLAHTLRVATAVGADIVLSVAEPPGRGLRPPTDVAVEIQAAGDLGHRLAVAVERRFAEGYGRVVVIGSDCPELEPRHLEAALEGLAAHPVVVGPAEDGGYWLIGLCAPVPGLFADLPWSTADVLELTRGRLRELDLSWLELDTLHDLDTEADLRRFLAECASSELVRHLRSALARLGQEVIE
jgi:rSAM/selenodomain-associated transferase 1